MTTKKQDVKEKEVKAKKQKEDKKEDNNLQEKNSILSIIELIAIILFVVIVLVFFKGTVVYNIVVLLLMLSALIFVHELGHFIMAKKFGVHVYEFAIGMGPLVYSFRRKNDPTLYSLRALPIGGYNAIAGESYDDDDKIPKEGKMCYKPKYQRLLILVAGVTMNFLTAFVLLFIIGFTGVTDQNNIVYQVEPNTPAATAGIVPGDKIIKLNGHKIDTWNYLSVVTILKNPDNKYVYEIEHKDGTRNTYEITPRDAVQDTQGNIYYVDETNTVDKIVTDHNLKKGEYDETKIIGVQGDTEIKYGIKAAFSYACKRFVTIIRSMLLIIGSLFTGKLSLDALSGPVGMYTVVKQVTKVGFINVLYLTAYLSVNLGVMNILPFPAFDGGHVLFVLIEYITGKRVNEKFENLCHTIGFILLLLLMVFVLYNDIIRLIG